MGMAMKSAYGKSRDSLAGLFGGGSATSQTEDGEKIAANDPLLLQNRPASVGPEVFIANGQLWESTGNFERAMENYSKALDKHPDNAAALASIARLNVRQNRLDEGIKYFERAIQAAPSEAALYHDMGLALSKHGRHDDALAAVAKSLAIAPGTSRYANSHAAILFTAGREDEARAELLKSNKPAVAHYNMAYLYYSSQRTDLALQELGQVLAMGPQADGDAASQRAFERSKELFEKLGGPATQIAQALPQLYNAAGESAAAVAAVSKDAASIAAEVRDTASGVTAKLSSGTATATPPATAPAPQEPVQQTANTQVAAQPTATAAPVATNPLATSAVAAQSPSATPTPTATPTPPAATASTATASGPVTSGAEVRPASGSMFQLPPELFAPAESEPTVRTAEASPETAPPTKTR